MRWLIVLYMILVVSQPLIAQAPTDEPTPNPTVQALQEKLENLEERFDTVTTAANIQAGIGASPAILSSGVAALAGLGIGLTAVVSIIIWSNRQLNKHKADVEVRLKQETEANEIYIRDNIRIIQQRADPRHRTIHIPDSNELEFARKHLENIGFTKLKLYDSDGLTPSSSKGITVYHVHAVKVDEAVQNDQDIKHILNPLIRFIRVESVKPTEAAFVIYSTGEQIDRNHINALLEEFKGMVTLAVTPVTLVTALYDIALGLDSMSNPKI